MSASSSSAAPTPLEPGMRAPLTALEIVRTLVLVVALISFAFWGVMAWVDVFPWNIVVAVVTPAVALGIWALFVSPKAVVRVHPFVRVLIELLIFAGATLAWWSLGQGIVGLAFAVVAVGSGVASGRRAIG